MTRGIDLSNFQPVPTPAECTALLSNDRTFAFVGLQYPKSHVFPAGHAREQVVALRDNGIAVPGVYFESFDPGSVWGCVADLGGFRYGAVTVEDGAGFTTEAAIDAVIGFARSVGLEPVIYTSAYMWRTLGLSYLTKYGEQGVKLWLALYDETDALAAPGFGGWDTCWMKQTTGEGQVPGIGYTLDLNYTEDTFDAPVQQQEATVTNETPEQRYLRRMQEAQAELAPADPPAPRVETATEYRGKEADGAYVYVTTQRVYVP